MNQIQKIIAREYKTRVRKKSFLLMTFLSPIFFSLLFLSMIFISSTEDNDVKTIGVIDSTKAFIYAIPETKYLKFEYLAPGTTVEEIREKFDEKGYYALLYISHIVHSTPSAVQLMSYKTPSTSVVMHITNAIEKEIEQQKLSAYKIDDIDNILKSVKTSIFIRSIKWERDGGESLKNTGLAVAISYISGLLTFVFIFMFATQLMRGVIEEKTNRIIEVIISSVRPFNLMAGKIIGVALVALTQFVAWVLLSFIFITIIQHHMMPDVSQMQEQVQAADIMATSSSLMEKQQPVISEKMLETQNIIEGLKDTNFAVMIGSFLIFFFGGYLLYASLFAAVGAVSDTDTDTQQFTIPVTLPLVLSVFVMLNTIQNPDGDISFWFSMIPFTSPVVMMARIPYGVPYWQIILSISILISTIILSIYVAAKIYKTGILMYGKKPSYKEIFKWLKY